MLHSLKLVAIFAATGLVITQQSPGPGAASSSLATASTTLAIFDSILQNVIDPPCESLLLLMLAAGLGGARARVALPPPSPRRVDDPTQDSSELMVESGDANQVSLLNTPALGGDMSPYNGRREQGVRTFCAAATRAQS